MQEPRWVKETLLPLGPELVSLSSLLSALRGYQHSSRGAWPNLPKLPFDLAHSLYLVL